MTTFGLHVHVQPQENQRIYKDGTVLEDAKSLAELKIENDDVLALTYKQEGEAGLGLGRSKKLAAGLCILRCLVGLFISDCQEAPIS